MVCFGEMGDGSFEPSLHIAQLIAQTFNRPEYCVGDDEGLAYQCGPNLFVISGEGSTLCDFSDSVETEFRKLNADTVVEFKDGDEEWERC